MFKALGLSQIIVIVVVAVALILSWDFGRRILETAKLVEAVQAADRALENAEQVNVQLKDLKQRVTTDEWVEKQARTNLHYARENETQFIPAKTPAAPGAPSPVVTPPTTTRPVWQDLLEAIFGPSQ